MHVSYSLPSAVELGAKRHVRMDLDITRTDGGFEDRNRRWSQFLFDYDVSYPISLRDSSTLATLTAAFMATGGGESSFDFKDWRDHNAADELFATGDGSTTVFPLVKTYAFGPVSHSRTIQRPVSPVTLKKNGVVTASGFTVDYELGIVTFSAAPLGGGTPDTWTWSGEFNVPVRFDQEQVSEAVTTRLEHLDSMVLYGVRLSASDFS